MKKYIFLILFLGNNVFGAATSFYVRTAGNGGDNANGGSSWADAWATIQHAADNANPSGGTPMTIYVAAGTYTENSIYFDVYAGVDDNNRIILYGDIENTSGDGATRPIISNAGTESIRFTKDYITCNYIEATGGTHGILGVGADYLRINNCIARDVSSIGFNACSTSNDADIYNSVAYNCTDGFWTQDGGNPAGKIYNCVAFDCTHGFRFNSLDGNDWAIIKNCIGYNNSTSQICYSDNTIADEVSTDYNCWYKNTGTNVGKIDGSCYTTLSSWQTASGDETNSNEADPKFVDVANDDTHITDNTSSCYQTGVDLSGTFTDDYDGDTRVHWDIGMDYIATAVPAPSFSPQRRSFIIGSIKKLFQKTLDCVGLTNCYAVEISTPPTDLEMILAMDDMERKIISKKAPNSDIVLQVMQIYWSNKLNKKVAIKSRDWDIENPIMRNGKVIGHRQKPQTKPEKEKITGIVIDVVSSFEWSKPISFVKIGDEYIIDNATYTVIATTPTDSKVLITGTTYYIDGSTYIISAYDAKKGGWLTGVVGIIVVIIGGVVAFLKKKQKSKIEGSEV